MWWLGQQMADILVSPAEPKSLWELGEVSSEPEKFGMDFLWSSPMGQVGVQRKEIHDLVASLGDGRLQREVGQAASLDLAYVVIEGLLQWRKDGTFFGGHWGVRYRFSRKHLAGLCFSLTSRGVGVLFTVSTEKTAEHIRWLYDWTLKENHSSLQVRPKPQGEWGTATNHDYAIHLLQGFQGIGPGTAGKLIERFGGVPLRWTCTFEEMQSVAGIGKKRAEQMFNALARRMCECPPGEQMPDGDNPNRCYRCSQEIR